MTGELVNKVSHVIESLFGLGVMHPRAFVMDERDHRLEIVEEEVHVGAAAL